MSSIRKSAPRLFGAAAAVALAALSLTACGSDDDTGARPEASGTPTSQAAPPSASTTATTAPEPTKKADPDATSGSTGATGGNGGTGGTDKAPATKKPSAGKPAADSGSAVACQGSNTRTVASELTRPANTMLLTVTNTGKLTCYLYGYPALRFTDAQSVPPAYPDSKPQAVVTLRPGESGYAAVTESAGDKSGTNGRTVHSLTVYFQGRSGTGSIGAGSNPALPKKGAYIDDSLTTTYWQQSLDDAVTW